jgi:hypothetical protein
VRLALPSAAASAPAQKKKQQSRPFDFNTPVPVCHGQSTSFDFKFQAGPSSDTVPMEQSSVEQSPPWTVPSIPVLDTQDTDMEVDKEAVEDFIRSMEQTNAEPYYPLDQFPVDHFPVDQSHHYADVNMQDTAAQQNDQQGFMHVEQSGFGQGFQ